MKKMTSPQTTSAIADNGQLRQRLSEPQNEYRHPCGKRFDLLVPEFIEDMARVMDVGSKKYGDNNWKTGLTGENSGLNHAMGHLLDYQAGRKSDHSDDPRFLLAQVAVNAMFEYFHAKPQ